jgi:hypothetical protein
MTPPNGLPLAGKKDRVRSAVVEQFIPFARQGFKSSGVAVNLYLQAIASR